MSKKVRMLRTAKGSPNGITVITFEAEKEYTMEDDLANVFINQMKVATEVFASFKEEKALTEAPFNKAAIVPEMEETTPKVRKYKRRNN